MMIDRYAEEAQKTANTKRVHDKFMHGWMGLIGESGEIVDILKKLRFMGMNWPLAKEKLIDEACDVMWYAVEYCRGAGMNFKGVVLDATVNFEQRHGMNGAPADLFPIALEICRQACLLDGKQPPQERRIIITEIMTQLMLLIDCCDVDAPYVMDRNIAKLRARYGETFDANKSNARYQ